ncbi:hypothetical protein DAKH74_015020 [Maudiozyma humilis]|uniref:Uncharacterized protein n=1 Tax=Maudiozyma humilis TaxID=51915 RepID=A0AAV5RTL8_MAUHU|nr:hypothetical protein DAKH74_015020 [Kazachstania humilis]
MSSPQRNVSTPLELHQLNLVKKQQNQPPSLPPRNRNTERADSLEESDKASDSGVRHAAPPITPKKTLIAPVTPAKKPVEEPIPEDESSVIYRLASKKREIGELEEKLKFLKMELRDLEAEFRESQPQIAQSQSQFSQRQMQLQETFDGLKTRFSSTINSFAESRNAAAAGANGPASGSVNARNGNAQGGATGNAQGAGGRFFKGLMDKFNEFNVNEDEFDTKTNRDKVDKEFYLKEGYEIDDEEIENDAHDEKRFLNTIDDSTIQSIRR